ncbi:hypothetical protein Tco_1032931 [Tanacetum coccineum]|uniref:Uncharacterized protein n=1 Tax=Tanacetum coccineum TaxID=301880 RepID=A0ABQ5GDU1_9ASTR
MIVMSCMIVSCILLPLNKSERLERIMAQKKGRPSTFASFPSTFGQPSSSHHIDDDNDGNDEDNDDATTPSPITKSSSLSPPNAPSKNPSTKDTSSTFDAPLRPLNLILLQSHPSLDITLSLSPITLIDHLFESLSPPSPPTPPQPPIIGSNPF